MNYVHMSALNDLSSLLQLMSAPKASAKLVAELADAVTGYEEARLAYEVSISGSRAAQQALEDAKAHAEPVIAQADADRQEIVAARIDLQQQKAELDAQHTYVVAQLELLEARENAHVADSAAKQAQLDELIAAAQKDRDEAKSIRTTLAEKLALLQSV